MKVKHQTFGGGRMDQLLNHVRGFSFGGMTYDRGGLFGPILRPYLSLIMVETGTCTLRADGNLVKVSSGQTGIAAAETRFEFDYQKGVQTTVIWCEGFLPEGALSERDKTQAKMAPVATTSSIQNLCQIGLDTGHASRPDLNSLRDALGRRFAGRIFMKLARMSRTRTSLAIYSEHVAI